MFRLALGVLATIYMGALGVVMLAVPPNMPVNIHVLGFTILSLACVMFAMTVWSTEK